MKFSLALKKSTLKKSILKNCENGAKYAGKVLCTTFFVYVLLCTVSIKGQESVSASRDFYPQEIDRKLRLITKSTAAEVLPLQETCAAILNDLNSIVAHIEQKPAESCSELQRLEQSIKTLETLQKTWTVKVTDDNRQAYSPSAAALEEIILALHRRIYVWKPLLAAAAAEASPLTTLYDKNYSDIDRLKERTLAVEQYFTNQRRAADRQLGLTWCDYLETQTWLNELEECKQLAALPIRQVSLSAPSMPIEVLKMLCQRANTSLHRLESNTLTDEQRTFLQLPVVRTWKEELQLWTADIVTPMGVLRHLEQYESNGGISDMKIFAQYIEQLSTSKTAAYRQLGESVHRQYGMPNVRFFVSNALLSNHLPLAEKETASFRDVILDQPTVGRRQTETELAVSLVPHPTRLLTSLDVGIDLATYSRSDAFATQLFNVGQVSVVAKKTIELTEQGFLTEPCEVKIVDHRMRLVKLKTDFDPVPIVSRLFRSVVFDQYESKKYDARRETQRKILRQVRNQVDREVESRLTPINEKIKVISQYADEEFDLHVEQRNAQTEENWLLSSWGVRSKDALLSNAPAPETLPGSFADVKIHESLLNMLVGRFEFEGKHGSVGEFKEMLAEKLKQPSLATPEENDDVEVTFAAYNPVVVRFKDGRIELTISIAALKLNRQTYRDFQVIVRYKPAYDPEGRLVLMRDDYISLINVRAQVIMRAVFGKIFPVNRPLTLTPKMLTSEPQFEYLTTGHCRIEKGWLALALVEKE